MFYLFLRDKLTLLSLPSSVVYCIGTVNTGIHEFNLITSCCYTERSQTWTCTPEHRDTISKFCYCFSEWSVPGVSLNMVYAHHLPPTFAMACAGSIQAVPQQTKSLVLNPATGMASMIITELQLCSTVAVRVQTQFFVSSLNKSSKKKYSRQMPGFMSGVDGIAFYPWTPRSKVL